MRRRLTDEDRRARQTARDLKTHDIQKIGEHAAAVECYKRGWKADILSGGTPVIDLLIWNPELKRSTSVQVKSRKVYQQNRWNLSRLPPREKITIPIIGVFVQITKVEENLLDHKCHFYIIPPEDAKRLLNDVDEAYRIEKPKYDDHWIKNEDLEQFKNRWDLLWI